MNTKKLTNRVLSMLLVLVMVFGMVPVHAFAADNAKAVDATVIFTDLHTGNGDYKESTVKGIMTAFKNSGLPISSVTSGGDAFSSNESTYTAYTDTITGYIRNALGSNVPVSYVWSDHDRGAQNNSSSKTALDKTSRLVYGAGDDGVYGTADDGNYYVYALSMADLCTYDRYSTGFNYTASSNNRAKNGYTSTVPQAIENFLTDAAKLNKDRPLFIVSHQPLFDNRNDNGWAEDWCNAINEVGTEMDVAFFYGHNHKYDSGSDYYYAKGSTMPVATRKFTDGNSWNFNYQVGSGWQYDKDLASVNKVLNFTHMCAGYLSPATESGTTRKGTAMAITIYPDSIRYTTYNSSGIYNGSYAVDKTVTREFAVTEPEEPVVPSEPAQTEPTVPSEPEATEPTVPTEPEATEPPVSDELDSEKVYVLVDAPVDGGKYLIVNQTLTNGDLSKDWDTDDDGMAVIRNGEGISYGYAVPKAGTITDANGNVYTKGYIDYTDENAVWTVHASGKAWIIENDGYYLNKGSDNGVSATKNSMTWNYTANGDDSRLYNGSDYLYFTYYGGDRNSWRWRTGTESGTSSTRDIFFYQEVMLTAPDTEPDPTPDFTPEANDVVVGDSGYSYNKVASTSALQEGYYQLQNNHTSKYLTSTKTSNANRLNLDSNGQNHIWYIKPVSGGYTIQYGGPTGQYLTFSHEKAAMSNTAQTVKLQNTNGYWGIGATSGNPVAYLAREGTSNTSGSVHGYASNDYKYPGDVGMDWNLYQRVENRKTYSVGASNIHHYLGQNDNQVQLNYSLLVNGATGNLPAGGSWNFSTYKDIDGIVKNISSNGVITFNKVEGSCYIKVAYTWGEGTAYMYVKVISERDPNACEHKYTAVTVEATCTKDGSVTYTCTNCDDSYVEVIKAPGHDHKAKVTAPTCTEGGYTTYTCACGDTYVADEVAAKGHDYKAVVTAPTCETAGYTSYTCACGDTYVADETAALGHDYKAVVTAPTCETDGCTTHTCGNCGDVFVDSIIAAYGHDNTIETMAPTCIRPGTITTTCMNCGQTTVEKTPALGHTHKAVVTAPTCTEGGYTTYTCGCGDTYVADEVAALGHSYTEEVTQPTCEADGFIKYTCHCGDTYEETLAALGHNHEAVVTAPTCTEGGYTTYTCGCGDTYVADEVAALGHDYKAVMTAPTCETAGYTTYTCECGDTYVADEVAALGHAYEAVVTAPTCEDAGYTTYTCACGETYVADEVAALGHTHEAVVTAPTCQEGGYTTYTCACGDTYVADEVAATGHVYEAVVTDPTCLEGGYTTYTCDCGDTYVGDETAAHGHNYTSDDSNGYLVHTCEFCGDTYTENGAWIAVSFARLSGEGIQNYEDHEGATAETVLNKLSVELSNDGVNVSGTLTVNADMVTWDKAFNGDVVGTYTAKVVYNGIYLGTIVVNIGSEHVLETVTVAPTCEEQGYTETKCADCDYTVKTGVTEALGHSYTSEEKDGYVVYTCHCGDTYSEKTGPSYTNVTTVSNDNDYVVTVTSNGVTYALTHGNNTVSAVQVQVSGGQITSEITEDMVWSYSGNKLSYVSSGTTYYLYSYNSGNWWWTSPALGISADQSSDATFSNQQLKLGSYYLNFSNNAFGANSSGSTLNVFLES